MITDPAQWDAARWPHFAAREFACKGSGTLLIDPALLDLLELLRLRVGCPLPVTSGYRSPAHNRAVSSSGEVGPHTTGRAVDIGLSGGAALRLVRFALELGFTGVGVQQKGGGRFIHLDILTAPDFPRPTIWSY